MHQKKALGSYRRLTWCGFRHLQGAQGLTVLGSGSQANCNGQRIQNTTQKALLAWHKLWFRVARVGLSWRKIFENFLGVRARRREHVAVGLRQVLAVRGEGRGHHVPQRGTLRQAGEAATQGSKDWNEEALYLGFRVWGLGFIGFRA